MAFRCTGEAPFRLIGKVAKAHTRIIWSVSWAPDGRCLATGSRDNSVKLWSITENGEPSHAVGLQHALGAMIWSVH
jgi:WD40 repeat protein